MGRILVVDDSPDECELLRVTLDLAGYDVATAHNDAEALETFTESGADLVLLDLRFDGRTDGLTIGRRIRDLVDVPIIFLSASAQTDERVAAFEVGADDFIQKGMPRDELLSRIHAVLRRAAAPAAEVLRVGDLVVDDTAHVVLRNGRRLDLTPREFALLVTLVRHRGRVLSKQQLLSQVWGFDGYDDNVVEVHVSALRHKLEAAGPRLVHTVRGIGYVFRVDDPIPASAMHRRATDKA